MTISRDQWQAVRASLLDTGNRFADLLLSARDPHAPATAEWSVADTAAHVTSIALMYTALVRSDDAPPAIPGITDHVDNATVDTVAGLNDVVLRRFRERTPQALAEQLLSHIADVLRDSEGSDPAKPVSWLGRAQVPVAGILAHLVNELLVHGRDIARADRSPWTIPAPDAALFFDLFLVGMLRYDHGSLLGTGEPASDRRIAVEFRSHYTSPAALVLHNGRVTAEDPDGSPDVRLSFDPATLNLMLFHRISKARALLTGKVAIRGPRPWLLPTFLRTVRLPDRQPPKGTTPRRTP